MLGNKITNDGLPSSLVAGAGNTAPLISKLIVDTGSSISNRLAYNELTDCSDSKLLQEIENRLIGHGILLPKTFDTVRNLFDF